MRIKKQNDFKDCGLCVVEALHNHFWGKKLDIEDLRRASQISEKGMNIQSVIDLAEKNGVTIEAFNAPFEEVNKNSNEIMVALIESEGYGHYIIFKKVKNSYQIFDSSKGEYNLSIEEFKNIYKGIVLTVARGLGTKKEIEKSKLYQLILNSLPLVAWIMISILLGVIFSFVSTIFMKVTLDYVLPGHLVSTLNILTIGFAFIAILRVLNISLRKYLTRKLELTLEFEMINIFTTKLRTAKLNEINKFSRSDILRRYSLLEQVSIFISSGLFMVFNEVVVLIISTSLLIWISPTLFSLTLAAGLLSILVTISFHFLVNSDYEELPNLQMTSMEKRWDAISSLNNLKEDRFAKYISNNTNSTYLKYKAKENKIWATLSFQNLLLEIFHFTMPIIMTYIAINMIFSSEITIGTMMMYLGVFTTFISPMIQLCEFFIKLKQNLKSYRLVESFLLVSEEVDNYNGVVINNISNIKLTNYKFNLDKEILDINNFEVTESFRLIGKNGSGKSTLLKSLAVRNNFEGIQFNNMDVEYYSLCPLRNKIFLTSPENELISETIIDQITLKNQEALHLFEENMAKYDVKGFLEKKGINLKLKTINGGENLSSGQKQIVKILRLLAYKYDLILLDEAFENVDDETFNFFKDVLPKIHNNSIFVEVSHSKRFILNSKEVHIEEINKC